MAAVASARRITSLGVDILRLTLKMFFGMVRSFKQTICWPWWRTWLEKHRWLTQKRYFLVGIQFACSFWHLHTASINYCRSTWRLNLSDYFIYSRFSRIHNGIIRNGYSFCRRRESISLLDVFVCDRVEFDTLYGIYLYIFRDEVRTCEHSHLPHHPGPIPGDHRQYFVFFTWKLCYDILQRLPV